MSPVGKDGGSDAPRVDSRGDSITVDLGSGGHAGAGGSDAGGGTGGGGSGGMAGEGGQGGNVQTCDPNSPERQTDIANCGTCFNLCVAPNSNAQCIAGACVYTCIGGFFDADKNPANGCECIKSNGGVEACDNFDNNCNGMVDEGFDFQNDLANCGGCNKPCSFPFQNASCNKGVCTPGTCKDGFYDRDPNVPGCETACAKTNGGVEICDGLDNDCNGVVDDNPMAATITCKSSGVCAGVVPTCTGQGGWVCKYPTAVYQDVENTALGCDGKDNDCDGLTDEAFDIGKTCTVGSGPCAGTGSWVCDNTVTGGRRCMGLMKTPGVEVCNGVDDDCDGKIDELDSLSDKADDKVIYFAAKNVTVFAYEASRNDSTASNHGFDSAHRPCSVSGRQPWSNVTKEEAEAACEKIGTGWRLCTAMEWADVCNGTGTTAFPYGDNYTGATCNGNDYPKTAGQTTIATGAAASCYATLSGTATDKMFDASGNVKEWVLSTTATTGPFELRGGAYDIASFVDSSVTPAVTRAPGLQCDASIPAPSVAVRLPSVGFRCCRTGMLPP